MAITAIQGFNQDLKTVANRVQWVETSRVKITVRNIPFQKKFSKELTGRIKGLGINLFVHRYSLCINVNYHDTDDKSSQFSLLIKQTTKLTTEKACQTKFGETLAKNRER